VPNWIDLVWAAIGCSAATLALIHLHIGLRLREGRLHRAFSLFAASIAVSAALEWMLMHASTPAEYAALLRWEVAVILPMSLAMLYLVNALSPGPRWLFVAIVATRIGATVANFTTGDNLAFREVEALQEITLWGGQTVVTAIGTTNPWVALGQVNNLLLQVFTAVVIVRLLRQPASADRARKLRVLLAALGFMLFAVFWNAVAIWQGEPVPLMLSPPFLAIALVMAYELNSEVLRSAELARALRVAESNLRSNEGDLALAERAAGLGVWSWDTSSDTAMVSPRGLQLLGFAPDAKPTLAEIHESIEPQDLFQLRQIVASTRGGPSNEFSAELRLKRPPDEQRWIAVHGQVETDADTRARRLHGVMFDVSDRHRVDSHFQLLVSASPAAMLLVDAEGRIVLANVAAGTVCGCDAGELVGMQVDELVPDRQRGRHGGLRRGFGEAATRRIMSEQREVGLRRTDGEVVPVRVSLNPVSSGGMRFVIAVIEDLRERLAKDRELTRQRDALAHYARVGMMSELSGSLAHELNQPLAAILSNAQASKRFLDRAEPDLAEVGEGLVQIIDSGKRAGEIIRRMRAMLRKDEPQFVPLDLNDVVHDVLRLVHSDLIDHQVAVVQDLADNLPRVRGDRVQLQQVILNLVRNARDAMLGLADGRQLTLRTRAMPDGVTLQVADVGHGIPDADLERIFVPFVSSKADGLGFGLSLCRSLIEVHGGRIWATNNAPAGATVHLSLPALG
jgi:PAS domain S-box-containing protein